jgi:hypothetical protein
VVARYNENGHTSIRDTTERLEGLVGHASWNSRPIKNIATMHHDIDFARQSGGERRRVIREEIVTAAPPSYARLRRQIKAEM